MSQIPLVQKYCTCTDEFYNPSEIGKLQKEFESLRRKGMTAYEALQKMNIVRLCCRESLFNPPMIFINSENVGRIKDETGILAANTMTGIKIGKIQETIKDTPDIIPSKPLPELP